MTESNDFLDNLGNHQHQKMLREIANDKITPKKSDKTIQNDLYDEDVFKEISSKFNVNLITKSIYE